MPTQSPGKFAGQDNGWAAALIVPVVMEFHKSVVDFPSIKRVPGGASTDWRPTFSVRTIRCRCWI
jgi:arylsulfatase